MKLTCQCRRMKRLRLPRPVRAILGGAVVGGALAIGGAVTLAGAAAVGGVALVLKRREQKHIQVPDQQEAEEDFESEGKFAHPAKVPESGAGGSYLVDADCAGLIAADYPSQARGGGAANSSESDPSGGAHMAHLQNQVDALAWQNRQMEQQLAEKDAEMMRRNQLTEVLYLRYWETSGQEAYNFWSENNLVKPEGCYPDIFPMRVSKLATPGADAQIRRKLNDPHKAGDWIFEMQPSSFSSSVRVLAVTPEQPDELGILGRGKCGFVYYGEMHMQNDEVCACALKRVPYDTPERKSNINAELAALKDIVGRPGVVQCLGVFGDWDDHTGQEYLWIVLELAEGLELGPAMQQVRSLQLQPGNLDRCYETCKMLLHQLFTTLSWLHARGRAHGDLKYANLRVRMGMEPGDVEGLEVIDFGCSAIFQGRLGMVPLNLTGTSVFNSPECARNNPREYLDACAQDMWAAGVLAVALFAEFLPFTCSSLPGQESDWQGLCSQHNEWAASYQVPHAIATCADPILEELHRRIPDQAQYEEVAELLRHLCHPQSTARATADAALQARLFTSLAPPRCNDPVCLAATAFLDSAVACVLACLPGTISV
ncbi:Serine/threonine-protein kinase 33 [Trebouxia sp. C0009 RCD-2024]